MNNYRQNVEGELVAMLVGLASVGIFAVGLIWAMVFVVRWWVAL